MDFCWGRFAGVTWPIFGGDEDAPELGDHVGGGGLGFGAVPGSSGPVLGHVGWVVTSGGIPDDGDALAGQGEGDGAVHGRGQPVVGLARAEDLFRVFYRDFNRPLLIPLKLGSSPVWCPGRGPY